MQPTVFDRLSTWLTQQNISFDVLRHEAVFTSEDAARVRGTSLASGAKALICKADENFVMFVLPADRRLDSKRVRREHGIKSLRFASREEVFTLTGLAPGSIPPFGSLFQLATWCDEQLREQPRINFNAGDHGISISLNITDYLQAAQPRLAHVAE